MTRYAPLAVFMIVLAAFAAGLGTDPRTLPSPLIGRPAPSFALPLLDSPTQDFSPRALAGHVWVMNVWASWCSACLQEHPVLLDLARERAVPIIGLNYKDERQAALTWLARHGNPYALSIADADGRVGIDFGVYGVPETFLIDKQGVIRHKHIGPLSPEALDRDIRPLIRKLQQ